MRNIGLIMSGRSGILGSRPYTMEIPSFYSLRILKAPVHRRPNERSTTMNRSIKKSIMNITSKWTKAFLGGGLILLFVFTLVGHAVGQSCVIPPAGLISWWPADGNANDIQGVNNGILLDGATFATGMVGKAFSFDGTSRVSAPTTGLPIGNSDRTLDLWVKMNNVVANEAFFAGYGTFGSGGQTYQLGTYVGNNILFFSQWGESITGPALSTGEWYHVAVANVGDLVTLYLDGVAVASGNLHIDTASDTDLFIGSLPGDPDRRLDGLIDEVEIYNRALSATEIQSIFNAGSAGKCKAVFSSFFIKQTHINFNRKDGKDSFEIQGRFVPGAASNGINVLDEAVTIAIGEFSATFPAGSFVQHGNEHKFVGHADGVLAQIWKRGSEYYFRVHACHVDLGGKITNLTTIRLVVGDDAGEVNVEMMGELNLVKDPQ
jgi:Concanavalin A-like lectin/glucanases superfamily